MNDYQHPHFEAKPANAYSTSYTTTIISIQNEDRNKEGASTLSIMTASATPSIMTARITPFKMTLLIIMAF
jgi:hypothetical protein